MPLDAIVIFPSSPMAPNESGSNGMPVVQGKSKLTGMARCMRPRQRSAWLSTRRWYSPLLSSALSRYRNHLSNSLLTNLTVRHRRQVGRSRWKGKVEGGALTLS